MRNLIVFCSLFSTFLSAQTTGVLRGTVSDQTGAVIPGASVTAQPETGRSQTVTSTANGAYRFNALAPGTYSVQASAPGLVQPQAASVKVQGGAESTLDLALHIVGETQQITVTDTAGPEVTPDPAQNAEAQVLTGEALQALSDDADDLITDLQTLAGPAAGPNGGQVFVDGFTAGDGTLPAKETIREVRINQNPFSPEFETLGNGHIEILTKPGTSDLHGSAAYISGTDVFNSRNPFAAQKAPLLLKDFRGNVSDRINSHGSFSFTIDNRDIDNGDVIHVVTLDPALQIISPSSVAVTPMHRLYLSARGDYQLNSKNTLTVRWEPNLNSSRNAGIGVFTLPSESYRSRLIEHPISAVETATIGTSTVNETRFQFRHQHSVQTPDSTAPSIIVASAFNGGGATAGLHDYIHHHYEVQNYTTRLSAAHTWKFGVRLRAVSIQDRSEQGFNGTYTFGGAYAPILDANDQPVAPGAVCNHTGAPAAGCTTISSIEQYRRTLLFQGLGYTPQQIRMLGGGPTQFSISTGNPLEEAGGADIGLFAGDDWRLRPNLTLSFGARYETQENIRDRRDIAPRIAFAWAPAGSHKTTPSTVIRGGFGIFYDRINEQNVLAAQRFNGENQQQYILVAPDTFPGIPSLAGLSSTTRTIRTLSNSLRAPYLLQSSLSVERQLPGKSTLALTYINSHGLHDLRSRNINAPLPGTYTGVSGSGVLPYPGRGPIYNMESAGLYNQNQMIASLNSRINTRISFVATYTLSYVRSNTDGLGTFPANQYSLAGEYGPAFNDIRNRLSLGASLTTKWKLQWNSLIVLQSGAPFNIVTSQDIYGDTVLTARPGIASAPGPGVIATSYGLLDPNPQPGEQILPRNFGRGPGQRVVNLRLARTFHFGEPRNGARKGRYGLTFSAYARNLLNHLNPGPIVGNINSPFFGQANSLAAGSGAYFDNANNRRLELQAQFTF